MQAAYIAYKKFCYPNGLLSTTLLPPWTGQSLSSKKELETVGGMEVQGGEEKSTKSICHCGFLPETGLSWGWGQELIPHHS